MKLEGVSPENLMYHDGLPFAAEDSAAAVERDENKVPVAWRIFRSGANELVKNGIPGTLTLTAEDIDSILTHHRRKGELIPIDSCHYLHEFAKRKGLDEAEVLKICPDAVGAMGFGSLHRRGEELWLEGVKWNPTAYELLKEKMFRYFSPAIRGLVTPPLRVTSVALENQPCLNDLDSLAAGAEKRRSVTPQSGGNRMHEKLMQALCGLTGRDSLALEAETEVVEMAAVVESKTNLLKSIRDSLGLSDEVTDAAIAAALKGAIEKAGGYDAVKTELDALKLSGETSKCETLISQAVGIGKIPRKEQQDYARTHYGSDSLAMAAYLDQVGIEVPVGRINRGDLPPGTPGDAIELTAEDRKAITRLGVSEEEYMKHKKTLFGGGK